MSLLEILLCKGLAADAFAVAICKGMAKGNMNPATRLSWGCISELSGADATLGFFAGSALRRL